jgi:hypothetical protein
MRITGLTGQIRFRVTLAVLFAATPIGLLACRSGAEAKPAPESKGTASAAVAPPSNATQTFGAAITGTEQVTLAALEQAPSAYKGKTIVTSGTITAVCQERGCWMELSDGEDHDANVRMHGHSFFIPKDATGKRARVQATVVLVKDGKECEEMEATGASLELDATGVEIL